ncbi:MAG TPA: hypothetical protein VH640_14975, partial [Bryobacteraceae bacterium]
VEVDCSAFAPPPSTGTGTTTPPAGTVNQPTDVAPPVRGNIASVDECKVAYATIRAEGCFIRPLVVAVAVLPDDCESYRTGCMCGCCHCH